MTIKKHKKRSHSIRYFFAIIGTLILGWKVVTGFHDMNISYEGLRCVGEQLGPGFYEHWEQNNKWKKKNRWNEAAISYIKTYINPKKKTPTLESLKQHCSEYISFIKTSPFPTDKNTELEWEDEIIVNNWACSGLIPFYQEYNPAISGKRLKSMFLWAAFVLLCIVDLRRLHKIFIWSREDN